MQLKEENKKRKAKYTSLGEIFYSSEEWKRKKTISDLKNVGIPYTNLRAYLTTIPAYKAPGDFRDLVISNFPEAEPLFKRPIKN